LETTVDTDVEGSFGGQSGVDDCIERIAESINYAHSRVEKVVTGFTEICLFLNEIRDSRMTVARGVGGREEIPEIFLQFLRAQMCLLLRWDF